MRAPLLLDRSGPDYNQNESRRPQGTEKVLAEEALELRIAQGKVVMMLFELANAVLMPHRCSPRGQLPFSKRPTCTYATRVVNSKHVENALVQPNAEADPSHASHSIGLEIRSVDVSLGFSHFSDYWTIAV